jgi:Trypsin-like peptidase domain
MSISSDPLNSDPLNREWLDVSSVNPHLVNQFRPTLVSFLGFDRNRRAKFIGSGFILGGDENGQYAFVFTAKHVFDGLSDFQKPEQKHAVSALPEFTVQNKVSIEPSNLKVVWMGQIGTSMMNVVYAFYSKELDIACCIVMPQKTDKFLPYPIPLDCRTPTIGDTVHMISCAGMRSSESVAPQKQDGSGQIIEIERSVNIRIGRVTGLYQAGLRHYTFPCFTTSIPAEPGMSGGFVFLPEDGSTIAACGVVSGDFSTPEARKSMLSSGESVIASTWPALGLSVVESLSINSPKQTIYDMVKSGKMHIFGNSMDQFDIVRLGGDDYRIQRKTQQSP